MPLVAGTWTCVSLKPDAPDYHSVAFDPANINRFGIEVGGNAPARMYVDQLVY